MWLRVYGMSVNINGIYYVHVGEQARWDRSAGNSAIENVCIIIIKQLTIFRENIFFQAKKQRQKLR